MSNQTNKPTRYTWKRSAKDLIEREEGEYVLFDDYKEIERQNAALVAALDRMVKMHAMMMKKVNHGASFYDAATIREMNEAPLQAESALALAKGVGK